MVVTEDIYCRIPDELKVLFVKLDNPGKREVLEGFPDTGISSGGGTTPGKQRSGYVSTDASQSAMTLSRLNYVGGKDGKLGFGDSGTAARFFYHAKTSSRERHLGSMNCTHPTLKPIRLTHYLAKLILPPPHVDSQLLIPFAGAGSEGIGALKAGWKFIHMIDNDSQYCEFSEARITAALECDDFNWPAVERKRAVAKLPLDGKDVIDFLTRGLAIHLIDFFPFYLLFGNNSLLP